MVRVSSIRSRSARPENDDPNFRSSVGPAQPQPLYPCSPSSPDLGSADVAIPPWARARRHRRRPHCRYSSRPAWPRRTKVGTRRRPKRMLTLQRSTSWMDWSRRWTTRWMRPSHSCGTQSSWTRTTVTSLERGEQKSLASAGTAAHRWLRTAFSDDQLREQLVLEHERQSDAGHARARPGWCQFLAGGRDGVHERSVRGFARDHTSGDTGDRERGPRDVDQLAPEALNRITARARSRRSP
jgi:hypothetical protein